MIAVGALSACGDPAANAAAPLVAIDPTNVLPARSVPAPTPTLQNATTLPTTDPVGNPFGLLLGGAALSDQHRVELSRALGAAYFRPWYLTVEDWEGACYDAACELAPRAGLKLILTVRNNVGAGGATTPARDLTAYRQTVGRIVETYQPAVLVVEGEETSELAWAGGVDEYMAQLQAACEAAHARNAKCANGGLSSEAVALLVWADTVERGLLTEACAFTQRAAPDLPADLCRLTAIDQLHPSYQTLLAKSRQMLARYATTGQDYVNFHWYIPDKAALSEAVAYLRRTTTLPLMSNEFGQRDQTPEAVERLMAAALDLKLSIVVWFSLDRATPLSAALNNDDGSLRPNGEAFRAFMQSRYQSISELPAAVIAPTDVPNVAARGVPTFEAKPAPVQAGGTYTFSQMISDITYCTADDGTELKLDAYWPMQPADPAPAIMFVHGGGWVAGTKTGTPGMSYFLELARRGYFIASIDYRLAPTSTFPANIQDVKCAVRSLRANAAQYNLDPNRIGAWGASAGGHLVSLLGTSDQSTGWDAGQYLDQSSRVQAVVDMYGIHDLTTEYVVGNVRGLDRMVFRAKSQTDPILKEASSTTYASPDDPPFLILHGDFDETVPYTQSVILQDVLTAASVKSDLVIVHNGGHGFWARGGPIEPGYPVISRTILGFFDQYLR
ncbi:MAG: alpha/beta hydrolase [Chloroflexi bacterium]|nr:alpha/beta hydrolase [Chloroflexota bacterium]